MGVSPDLVRVFSLFAETRKTRVDGFESRHPLQKKALFLAVFTMNGAFFFWFEWRKEPEGAAVDRSTRRFSLRFD